MQLHVYFFDKAVQVKEFIVFGSVISVLKELLPGFGAEFQTPLAGWIG